ncbi:MAG: 6-phosphofructokinase [Spirochaetes bacterium]|nr:6-phosphofructokinase [Spirochaetota bacterium]MBU0955871.1 6-phosphofructokinase [Spirochaetota bacterium]
MKNSAVRRFGILTSGGDCPGLNAAIRGVAKAASGRYGMEIVGINHGYRGLIEGDARLMTEADFSGILTRGGTILGTSREKPFRKDEKPAERSILQTQSAAGCVDAAADNASDASYGSSKPELIANTIADLQLDALVVLGGNGTNTTASLLYSAGIPVIGLPKTIDNDIWGTDVSFGFHSAVSIATEAIDRLHTTAHSHNRVMIIELMGHKAGWLALYAGVAGGGDIILLPEIPYDIASVAASLERRRAAGKEFSIVVVAEGALSVEEAALPKKERKKARAAMAWPSIGYRVAAEIQQCSGMETRVTVLGYLQRGGIPAAYDRVLATAFGTAAADLLQAGEFGRMVTKRADSIGSIALAEVADRTRTVPVDHYLIGTARRVDTCFGDD